MLHKKPKKICILRYFCKKSLILAFFYATIVSVKVIDTNTKRKGVYTMEKTKTFQQLLLDQFARMADRFNEIEITDAEYGQQVWVWDDETKTSTYYRFNHKGDLIDIW
jgi:hypothetical protein